MVARRVAAHAAIGVRQRAVPPLVVDWLLEYGPRALAGQGVEKVYFDKQARRDLKRSIGRHTAGWRTKRLQH